MSATEQDWAPLSRDGMAARAAQDIPEGWYVNLGIGVPTLIGNHIPPEREVILHSENGVLGMGPAPEKHRENPWLINASSQRITLRVGASLVHHADSFAIVRGGHLDLCVLGGFQVAENGDLANWSHSPKEVARQIGGAMDLAVGAKRVWVVMEHVTKDGKPRILRRCSYPLTASACVTRVYTNMAVLDVTPAGFKVVEIIPGMSFSELQARSEAELIR
ncbi:3-oxoacid CoA-transferase subunit B [Siccirubricoccus sp. KC 17139]|uniref:3-oxoacid CoA-transferase subunit B n=1 Tax=Siccirubricoccus soli TaxID=2899147 RepID=A0ABT1D9Y5_9PROT|nr:3-oxoacid CoA-transferase subunit B [Siccirubricoccus soli]MCO6418749.1 3-oxoacid CoA-transferase subunit B [Siccirubricoccus soli]MCP2684884.1 3-oxoacid CoA-transferase subunit B [Siccirubricoccus soli]